MMRASPRNMTLDVLRGLSMALVVLGHALIGVQAALGENPISRFLIVLIYTTHMPVFFLLAGFLAHRLVGRDWRAFLGAVLVRVLWPYLLWSTLFLLLHHLASEFTNTRVDAFHPVSILWKPPAIMWFLYVLFIAFIAARILSPLGKGVTAAVGIGLIMLSYGVEMPFSQMRFIGVFLLARVLPRDALASPMENCILRFACVVGLITMGLAWWLSSAPLQDYPASEWVFLPAMLAGPVLLAWVANKISRSHRLGVPFRLMLALGQHSMAVFLLHIFFTAGGRVGLMALGLQHQVMLVCLVTILGLVGPLLLARWIASLGLSRVLGWQPVGIANGLAVGEKPKRKDAPLHRRNHEERG